MNTVEKAAEKLKSLQPGPQTPPPREEDAAVRYEPSIVERLQEHRRVIDEPVVEDDASPWHVDRDAFLRAGLLPAEDGASGQLADEVRRVKRPLLDNVGGKGAEPIARGERIMVTSAVPGEGKTFTAVNLALSLACEPDFEVVLVDGDVPKSEITRVLGLEGQPGLMKLLADEQLRPSDVVVQTDVPNLLVVPAGARHPLAAELFGGKRMEYVLDALGGRIRANV
ncbi:MAG: exopolysaccharide biosynthesis protein, partial [Rhodanobacteraceae bacterium]